MKHNYLKTWLTALLFSMSAIAFSQSGIYLNYDGENDFAALGAAGQYFTGNRISMTGWFNCNDLHYGQGYMGFRTADAGNGEFYIIQLHNGSMECRLRSTTGVYEYISPDNTAIAGQWQHFAWVMDVDSIKLYVDGSFIGGVSVLGQFDNPNVGFGIGKSLLTGFNFVFDGNIDEVSAWNKALSQTEIQDIINFDLTGTEDSLVMYYKFNQGIPFGDNTSITHLIDEVGSGDKDAELFEFALTGDISNFVTDELYASFTVSDTSVCAGNTIDFYDQTAGNPSSWDWTFEGGDPATSTAQYPVVTYNTTGTYDVQLIVSDGTDADTLLMTDYITIVTTPVQAELPVGPDAICTGGEMINYTIDPVPDATEYEWAIDPPEAGLMSGTDTVGTFVSLDWTGDFDITVRALNNCGTGDWSPALTATVYHLPEVFWLEEDGAYCDGGDGFELTLSGSESGVSYELFHEGTSTGTIVNGTGDPISFGLQTAPGLYTAVGYTDNCSRDMDGQPYISILYPPGEAGTIQGPDVVCNTSVATYTTSGAADADTLIWTLDPADAGVITSSNESISITWELTFTGAATLSVSGQNTCGFGDAATMEITVNGLPAPEVSGPDLVCDYESDVYETENHTGSTYGWAVVGGNIIAGAGTHMVTVHWAAAGNGSIAVAETDDCGTGSSTTMEVFIDDCTGVEENADHPLVFYPNPVSGVLHITGLDSADEVQLQVTTLQGALISNQSQTPDNGKVTLEMSGLPAGSYLVRIAQHHISHSKIIHKVR